MTIQNTFRIFVHNFPNHTFIKGRPARRQTTQDAKAYSTLFPGKWIHCHLRPAPLTGTVWFARSLSPTLSTSFILLGQLCKEKAFGMVSLIVSKIIALLVLCNEMFSPEKGIPSKCFVFSVAQVCFALGTFNVSRMSLPGHPSLSSSQQWWLQGQSVNCVRSLLFTLFRVFTKTRPPQGNC